MLNHQNLYYFWQVMLFSILTAVFLSACGGGSGGQSTETEISNKVAGYAQKGGFIADSEIVLSQLDESNFQELSSIDSVTLDKHGKFAASTNWDGWSQLNVTGRFFDEFAGALSAQELSLNSIQKIDSDMESNINLFTHLVHARMKSLLLNSSTSVDLDDAKKQATTDLKVQFGVNVDDVAYLDNNDGEGEFKNDNAILLLFSGGFLANNGSPTALLNLTDDFADDGMINAQGLEFFKKISNFAGKIENLSSLAANLKSYGVENPPELSDLNSIPSWFNAPPNAIVSPKSQTFIFGTTVTLDASLSSDPEGVNLTYSWKVDGVTVCDDHYICEINDLPVGEHKVTLLVGDENNSTNSDEATVTIVSDQIQNQIPQAVIDPSSLTIKQGLTATFDASKSFDNDGDSLAYSWSGPGTENCQSSSPICNITGLSKGEYFISVTVDDGKSGINSALARLSITDQNTPPKADAGPDQTISQDKSIELQGSATDSDGQVIAYEWKKEGISIGKTAKILINNLAVGTHEFLLFVTDNDGAISTDSMTVTVLGTTNKAPIAQAGEDFTQVQGQNILLSGSGFDEDGEVIKYEWYEGEKLLGTTSSLSIQNPATGQYEYTLVVFDNEGGSGSDSIIVTVIPMEVNVNISTTGCTSRIGRIFFVTLTLAGGITGSGTTLLQEYSGGGCTGEPLGNPISLPTQYTITNILTDDSGNTSATMTISNLAGSESQVVSIVDGNVVVP